MSGDPSPRLAYADLLDESGDAARAEFVRVQVELARLPDHDPARPALEDREHDLLAAHEAAWLGDAGSAVEWHWQRGFVEEVAASPGWMLDHGDDLFAAHPARRWRITFTGSDDLIDLVLSAGSGRAERLAALDLSGWPGTLHPIEPILAGVGFGNLRELDLAGMAGPDGLPALLDRAAFRDGLRVLRCAGIGPHRLDVGELAALSRVRLTELAIPATGLTAGDLRSLLNSPCCQNLTSLDIRNNDIGPDAWRAFRDAPGRLRELDLSGTGLWADDGALGRVFASEALADLRSLELNGWPTWGAFEAVVGSPFWRQAEDLRMHSAPIPSVEWQVLFAAAEGPPGLRALDLSDNILRDAGAAALAGSGWAGSLGWLALSYNEVTDAGARAVADSGRFARLRTLHLGGLHPTNLGQDGSAVLTPVGARVLAEAPSLARLRLLNLGGTRIGPAGVEAALNGRYWRLAGLGLSDCDLPAATVRVLAESPRLWRLTYLDLSHNPWLGDDVLMPLAESPHLCPLLELDIRGVPASDLVRAALRERLGRRLSE